MLKQISYFLSSSIQKKDILLSCIKDDPFIQNTFEQIKNHSFEISFSCFSKTARYYPQIAFYDSQEAYDQYPIEYFPVHLQIPLLRSFSCQLMLCIHELIHVYQDKNGLFFTKPFIKNTPFNIPSLDSEKRILLINEAVAYIETQHILKRLKNNTDSLDYDILLNQWYQKYGLFYRKQAENNHAYLKAMSENRIYQEISYQDIVTRYHNRSDGYFAYLSDIKNFLHKMEKTL